MYTSHGHHIVGTKIEPWTEDMKKMRCGGPRLCKVCSSQVLSYLYSNREDSEKDDPKNDDPTIGPTYLLN